VEVRVKALVQAQSLRGYPELVRELGGNPIPLLQDAGIDPADLNRLTVFVDFEAQMNLLERSAAELRCPDFGMRLAERQDIGVLGTLAVAMRYSATLGEAIQCVCKYFEIYNTAIAFTIWTGNPSGEALLELRPLEQHYPLGAQVAERGVYLTARIITLLSEGRCELLRVSLPHPPVSNKAIYRTYFAAPITFGAEVAGIAIAERDLYLPISEHNAELRDAATHSLDIQLSREDKALADRVRRTVIASLGTANCGRNEVAKALFIHPRTMQRRLNEDGTSFEDIKEEVRRELALRYLSQPNLSMSQITRLLGYGEQSTFGRSCRRWFGRSPREMRERLEAESHDTAT
jgi:AraC-like DNA-binding protein